MKLAVPIRTSLAEGETLLLRSPEPADAEAIIALLKSVVAEEQYLLVSPDEADLTVEQEMVWIQTKSRSRNELHVAAELNGVLVGMMGLIQDPFQRRRHVAQIGMFIGEPWRGRKMGTHMLQAMIDWARQHPEIEKLWLDVFEHNTRAIRLYEKLGFQQEGCQMKHVKTASGNYFNQVLMSLWVK